ncbi:unnamed protein product, partial [Aphanomyces euteiches]
MGNEAPQTPDRAKTSGTGNPADAAKSKDAGAEKKAVGADPAKIHTVEEKEPPKSGPAKG